MIKTALFAIMLLISIPAMAQESPAPVLMETPYKLNSTKYSPDYCEFTANFPEEPIVNNYCEVKDDPSTCYNLISYTKVLDMASSINIEIICNPASPQMYAEFTPEIMEDTVKKMTQGGLKETYDINTREEQGYRQTGLIGAGQKGLDSTIYLAQLWISEKSIMSVEAEMSGAQTDAADALFANILRSIGYKKEIEDATVNNPESGESPEPKAPKAP